MSTILLTLMFTQVTVELNLPPGLLESLCFVESSHKIASVHYNDGIGNSIGICQIKLVAAKQMGYRGSEVGLLDPETNIYYAGKFLAHQYTRYNKSVTKAIIAYNIGHAGSLTTTSYSVKVIKQWRQDGVRTAASYSN